MLYLPSLERSEVQSTPHTARSICSTQKVVELENKFEYEKARYIRLLPYIDGRKDATKLSWKLELGLLTI